MKVLNFGNNLRNLREDHGLSMDSFCSTFNERYNAKLNKSTVSRYENESQEPALSTAVKIAEYFSIEVDDLLYGNSSAKGIRIPVYGKVAAGIPLEMVEDIIDYEEIPAKWGDPSDFFCLQIEGNSMEPRIANGDVVVVKKQADADTGDIVIFSVNGEYASCKRLRKMDDGLMFIPNNNEYFPKMYRWDEVKDLPVQILGKVIELRAKF